MRKVIGTPSQIPARSFHQGLPFLLLPHDSSCYLRLSPTTLYSCPVNLPISECNLERILRPSCRTYTSPGVLWNRMEGKRDVESEWKE